MVLIDGIRTRLVLALQRRSSAIRIGENALMEFKIELPSVRVCLASNRAMLYVELQIIKLLQTLFVKNLDLCQLKIATALSHVQEPLKQPKNAQT